MAAVGGATDLIGGIGQVVLGGLQYSNQKKVQEQQLLLANKALSLQQQQLEWQRTVQNPIAMYSQAMSHGFDPVSARQLAGSAERRVYGGANLPPISSMHLDNLRETHAGQRFLNAHLAFTQGVGSANKYVVNPPGQPVLRAQGTRL